MFFKIFVLFLTFCFFFFLFAMMIIMMIMMRRVLDFRIRSFLTDFHLKCSTTHTHTQSVLKKLFIFFFFISMFCFVCYCSYFIVFVVVVGSRCFCYFVCFFFAVNANIKSFFLFSLLVTVALDSRLFQNSSNFFLPQLRLLPENLTKCLLSLCIFKLENK